MKNTIVRLILLILPHGLWAQEPPASFSLKEAVEWGMTYNRTLQRASLELQKAHKEKWKTISIGFPQINANMQYQNNIEQPVTLIPAQFFGGNEGEFTEAIFGTKQTAFAMAELSQLLFDGTYIVGVQGIQHYIKMAENVLEKTQIEVKKAIVTAYVNALVVKASLAILEKNATVLKKNIQETQALFDNGFTEEENLEQLQLTLANLTTQIDYTKQAEILADNVLKLLLGIEIDARPQWSNSLEQLTTLHLLKQNVEDYTNNIDIRLAEDNVVSEKLLYRLEKAKALPSFSAFINGSYMGNNDTFNFTDRRQKWFGSSAFGLRLRVPIFSSFGRAAGTQKAKLTLKQAETSLIETRSEVFVAWQNAINNFNLAQNNLETSKKNLALAQRIEQKNTVKFFEGLASSFELRQAQLQLYQAQQTWIQSMRQVILDKTTLTTIINNAQ
ncbi:MAG: TolC family protein [Flavobacteriaceae bacterium]